MMAALWSDIDTDIRSAIKHYTKAIALFRSARFGVADLDYYDEMALMHAMQSGYTLFEAGLKRTFSLLNEDLPKGGDSHRAMLNRAGRSLEESRPAIIDETLHTALVGLLGFRHVAIHTYDYLDGDRAAFAIKDAETFVLGIEPAIARFRAVIDPD